MSLSIKFSRESRSKDLELHVPISFEFAREIEASSHNIIEIYADGHEHWLIIQRFRNLPSGHASTTWTGEFARFIADNFTSLQ